MDVADRYRYIYEDVVATAHRCGRNPSEITLVAVSKGYSWEHVEPAYLEGCRHFGENRLPEALLKISQAPQGIQWHMIGSLQRNKIRKVIGKFVMIHSVDTLEIAIRISECSQELGVVTPVLLQVNTSGEASKHGLCADKWREVFDALVYLPGISLEGLMTIAPLTGDEQWIRKCFARLRQLRDELALLSNAPMRHLSMGMSNDYRLAIEEGATFLRLGTSLFK